MVENGIRKGDQMDGKACTGCGQILARTEYYRDKRAKDGLYSTCKQCTMARRREGGKGALAVARWRAKNREHVRAYDREYYQAHKAARNASQQRYRAKKKLRTQGKRGP